MEVDLCVPINTELYLIIINDLTIVQFHFTRGPDCFGLL